jgi:hypothetical protein
LLNEWKLYGGSASLINQLILDAIPKNTIDLKGNQVIKIKTRFEFQSRKTLKK